MIESEFKAGLMEWALCAPPGNEIGREMLVSLQTKLKELKQLQGVKALLMYSKVPHVFCSGAHLRELHDELKRRSPVEAKTELGNYLDDIHELMHAIDALDTPTIACVEGLCFGGGLELLLCCDLRIADKSARFAFPELRLGIIPGFGGIPRLARDVSNALIRDLLFTGRSINAKKAFEANLLNQVVTEGQAMKAARQLAFQISKYPSPVAAQAKSFFKPLPKDRLEKEKELFLKMFFENNTQAALEDFVERDDALPYLAR